MNLVSFYKKKPKNYDGRKGAESLEMFLVSDRTKFEKAGESGMNNQRYQPLYLISKKNVQNHHLKKDGLSTGPLYYTLLFVILMDNTS